MDDSATFRVSQWAPANETESALIEERLLLNGTVIGAVAYGIRDVQNSVLPLSC